MAAPNPYPPWPHCADVRDRCLVGACIHTMTDPDAKATAIAWQDGRILAVGDDDTVRTAAQNAGIPTEDAGGRCIIPGFMDAHMHFLHVGVRQLRPDLREATSRQDGERRTRAWLDAHPGAGAVIAEGWDESHWDDSRFPTREDLDALAPDRPLVWRRQCGHIAIGNTRALPAIHERWPELVNTESGLVEEAASLYLNEVLPVSEADLDRALQMAQDEAHRLGVTGVGEYTQAPFRHALLRADAAGTLRVRLANHIYVQMLDEEIAAGFRTGKRHSPWLRDGGLKVFLDGSFGGRTAYMRAPYKDDPHGGRGEPIWTDDELDNWFGRSHRAGIQVTAHAIGDAAIDQGLDAYERLRATQEADGEAWDDNPLRHRFEHYELPHDDAVARTKDLGLWACAQPNFVGEWSAPGGMYHQRMGDTFLLNNRFRTFLDEGLRLCFGSDGMPFGPLVGLQAAIDHPVEEERITLAEAVWLYTQCAAAACHWDDAIGTLEQGKMADVLILPPRAMESIAPKEWVFEETIVDGQTVCRGVETPFPA